ncbi:MAG: hypothetical protein M3Z21_09480 [Pseudomonadota bacterium]|nr:hypothetical protein [Pseudomonadota bacterium]
MGDSHNGRWARLRSISVALLLAVLVMAIIGALFFFSDAPLAVRDAGTWFDPVYYQYNLLLLALAVLVVPVVTGNYVASMGEVKRTRLCRELPPEQWQTHREMIEATISRQFRMSNYGGSMLALMAVIFAGAAIILVFKLKPVVPLADLPAAGVDFGRGANFLILGPGMEQFIHGDGPEYYHRLVLSLTAFQFGFLGAYIYFLGQLGRSFGHFPERGLLFLEKLSLTKLGLHWEDYRARSLSQLQGMSYSHEVRLRSEGFDNLENLAHALPLDLALRTGFSHSQLQQWVGEAWLRVHLGDADYQRFVEASGMVSAYELQAMLEAEPGERREAPLAALIQDPLLLKKVNVVNRLFTLTSTVRQAALNFAPGRLAEG